MKKVLPVLIAILVGIYPLPVFAATGSIQVTLPEEMKGMVLNYAKVGEWENVKQLQETIPYDGFVTVDEKGNAKIENLEEGIYLIEFTENSEYKVMPATVSIPMWDEEEQRMLYDVSVIPKYSRNSIEETGAPNTGDVSAGALYAGFIGISFIIVVIISCHNRFKCGRMSHKYSR